MGVDRILEILRYPEDRIIRVGIVLVLMLTTVLPVERRWMACEVWMSYGIPVVLLIGTVILIWRKQRFNCTLTDIVVLAWFTYYVCMAWIGNEWPCRMEFLKTTECFLLYVALRIAFHGTRMSAWVLIGSILVFGCYEAWLGASQLYGTEVSRHSLFALTGSFLNPGPYSAYLMIGLVVGLTSLNGHTEPHCDIKGVWRHFILGAVVLMAVILPATWSRAAFLGIAAVVMFVYWDRYWRYRYLVWGALLAVAVGLYLIKQGSAEGRLIIWRAALTSWTDTPWLGVGVGGFLHAFAEGMSQLSASDIDFSSANVPDGAYNILLKIVVEQGVVGGLMAIGLAASTMYRLSGNSKPLFYGLVALLVFAMFSYPFDLLPYKVIAVLIIAWSESVGGKRMFDISRLVVLLMSCFFSFASWQAGKIAERSYEIEQDGYMQLGYIGYSSIKERYRHLAHENDNPEFLFAFGKKLRDEGHYNNSNAILRQGTRCSADPMFYVLMGNNYKDMKHYDLAEQSYKKAFSVMPNRLYPLYQLMMLYHDMGEGRKARAMAKRITNMKPKIVSHATKEMKSKATIIIK